LLIHHPASGIGSVAGDVDSIFGGFFPNAKTTNPVAQSFAAAIASAYPGITTVSNLSIPEATDSGASAFAVDPISYINTRQTAWGTALPTSLRSAYDAYYTSGALADASSIRSALSITQMPTTAPLRATVDAVTSVVNSVTSAMGSSGKSEAPKAGQGVLVSAGAVAALVGFVAALL